MVYRIVGTLWAKLFSDGHRSQPFTRVRQNLPISERQTRDMNRMNQWNRALPKNLIKMPEETLFTALKLFLFFLCDSLLPSEGPGYEAMMVNDVESNNQWTEYNVQKIFQEVPYEHCETIIYLFGFLNAYLSHKNLNPFLDPEQRLTAHELADSITKCLVFHPYTQLPRKFVAFLIEKIDNRMKKTIRSIVSKNNTKKVKFQIRARKMPWAVV